MKIMSTQIETKSNLDDCVPRNALFCCRSPVCTNDTPKLLPPKSSSVCEMDSHFPTKDTNSNGRIFPVAVPDLSDPKFYTNLLSQPPKSVDPSHPSFDFSPGQQSTKQNAVNKSQSAQDLRLALRRVTPPKSSVIVKKNETPMMGVVLRKVDKKLLEPPKPIKHEQSPPPRKLTLRAVTGLTTSASTSTIGSATITATEAAKKKKVRKVTSGQSALALAKSKSTNDVIGKQKDKATGSMGAAKPPANLFSKTQRPLEVHKIEGDRIIIIRRVPRGHRQAELKMSQTMPASLQVTELCCCISMSCDSFVFYFHVSHQFR